MLFWAWVLLGLLMSSCGGCHEEPLRRSSQAPDSPPLDLGASADMGLPDEGSPQDELVTFLSLAWLPDGLSVQVLATRPRRGAAGFPLRPRAPIELRVLDDGQLLAQGFIEPTLQVVAEPDEHGQGHETLSVPATSTLLATPAVRGTLQVQWRRVEDEQGQPLTPGPWLQATVQQPQTPPAGGLRPLSGPPCTMELMEDQALNPEALHVVFVPHALSEEDSLLSGPERFEQYRQLARHLLADMRQVSPWWADRPEVQFHLSDWDILPHVRPASINRGATMLGRLQEDFAACRLRHFPGGAVPRYIIALSAAPTSPERAFALYGSGFMFRVDVTHNANGFVMSHEFGHTLGRLADVYPGCSHTAAARAPNVFRPGNGRMALPPDDRWRCVVQGARGPDARVMDCGDGELAGYYDGTCERDGIYRICDTRNWMGLEYHERSLQRATSGPPQRDYNPLELAMMEAHLRYELGPGQYIDNRRQATVPVRTGAKEALGGCNGVDDDLDGAIDEGCDCALTECGELADCASCAATPGCGWRAQDAAPDAATDPSAQLTQGTCVRVDGVQALVTEPQTCFSQLADAQEAGLTGAHDCPSWTFTDGVLTLDGDIVKVAQSESDPGYTLIRFESGDPTQSQLHATLHIEGDIQDGWTGDWHTPAQVFTVHGGPRRRWQTDQHTAQLSIRRWADGLMRGVITNAPNTVATYVELVGRDDQPRFSARQGYLLTFRAPHKSRSQDFARRCAR